MTKHVRNYEEEIPICIRNKIIKFMMENVPHQRINLYCEKANFRKQQSL